MDEVVVIATYFVARKTDSLEFIARNNWRCSWLEALLNLTGKGEFAFETLPFQTLFYKSRILYSDRCH